MDRPDLAWKLLLQRRLPAVLALLFPPIHALVDWRLLYCLPDKHLLPARADARTGEREPDFVALVTLVDGSQACLHLEIQCTRQAGFAQRMALYHARLRDRFALPVYSLAILGDRSPTWRPEGSSDLHAGCDTTFQFRIAKLLDFRDRQLSLQRPAEPAAWALAAHLLTIATRRRPELRKQAKLRLLRQLHEQRPPRRELNEAQQVLDWMLPLPAAWERSLAMDYDQFMQEHEKVDKNSLNYLIPELILRRHKASAIAAGMAEGKASGQRQLLELQLTIRFGQPDRHTLRALDEADCAQLERLAIALLDADSAEGALRAAGLRL